MTVYVVGNCQALVVMQCLARMNPELPLAMLDRDADVTGQTREADLILWQHLPIYPLPDTPRRVVSFPTLYFNAFHPDCVRVEGPEGLIRSPLSYWHSSLAFAGWSGGLTVDQTLRLFCEPVFEQLGFFDFWAVARDSLLSSAREAALALDAQFARWSDAGCFMHLVNHPKLNVLADVALAVAERAGLPVAGDRAARAIDDPFATGPSWPVYPELGERLGVPGDYVFTRARGSAPGSDTEFGLEGFLTRSFQLYASFGQGALRCARLDDARYRELDPHGARSEGAVKAADRRPNEARSPYARLEPFHFWRRAVEQVDPGALDPIVETPLPVDRETRVATAGSCFAQHLAGALGRFGYRHLITEEAPAGSSPESQRDRGFGVFSARFGNIYTARQLVQLFDRAYGTFEPRDVAWLRPDDRYADPFRPQIEPGGFATVEDLRSDRVDHLEAVRAMFERLEVLAFTLGLTEAWRARADGAVFPLAPGVTAGGFDRAAYEFHNFSFAEVTADLHGMLARLASVNPTADVILTVSPVPLIATYEPRHVLVSSTASKAILRAAADEIGRRHACVRYFPAYEIVTAVPHRGAYFAADTRTPTAEAVAHVLRLFFAHCRDAGAQTRAWNDILRDEIARGAEIVCDEEEITGGTSALAIS